MIRCTEIFSKPDEYDSSLGIVTGTYSVREVILNPDYIFMMKENNELFEKAQKAELVEGLSQDLLYTQIFLNTPNNTVQLLNVVGSAEEIVKKFQEGL